MKSPRSASPKAVAPAGFTLVEAMVAIALVGLGVSVTIGALTKFNQFSTVSRNSTGAYALAMSKIDEIQSVPFNPAGGVNPRLLNPANSPTTELDLPIYDDPRVAGALVLGKRTTVVAMLTVNGVNVYRTTVTVAYPKPSYRYSLDMSTVRVSD
ncbi:MAG: hypothetical protein DLM52_01740 [Chthoniobacterales bacterium]|nr:MAG: hypothetical protein DLM52_01740 [Chthoniobacterales bacterium]